MKTLFIFTIALVWISYVSADDSLLIYLPFDDGSGTDVTENGNNGEFMDDVMTADGKLGGGIELAAGGYVDIPWSESIDIADSSFSVEICFKYTEAAESGSLVWAYDMGSGPHAQFWIRTEPGSSRIRGLINDGGGDPSVIVVTKDPYNDDDWHHLAFVKDSDAGSLTMYIDGKVTESNEGKVGSLTGTQRMGIWLGQRGIDGINKYTGFLDEFRLWNRVLSVDEIKVNMTKGQDYFLSVQPAHNLIVTWAELKLLVERKSEHE